MLDRLKHTNDKQGFVKHAWDIGKKKIIKECCVPLGKFLCKKIPLAFLQ